MSKDEAQDTALTRLTKLISCGAQVTVLKQVQQYLIDPGHQTIEELGTWVGKEIKRLEKMKDGI